MVVYCNDFFFRTGHAVARLDSTLDVISAGRFGFVVLFVGLLSSLFSSLGFNMVHPEISPWKRRNSSFEDCIIRISSSSTVGGLCQGRDCYSGI